MSVADEIERLLGAADLLPTKRQIPRSTMNRLLSAEPFRNRLGISVTKGKFEFTHKEDVVLKALARVADEMANRRLVLGNIWDVDGKQAYLDKLDGEGVLPRASDVVSGSSSKPSKTKPAKAKPTTVAKPTPQTTLKPSTGSHGPVAYAATMKSGRSCNSICFSRSTRTRSPFFSASFWNCQLKTTSRRRAWLCRTMIS